jgi:hypothetical protein
MILQIVAPGAFYGPYQRIRSTSSAPSTIPATMLAALVAHAEIAANCGSAMAPRRVANA